MEKTVYESNVPRVYTLYRVSTIGQVEKDDIPMQKQVCRDFAKKQGWVVIKEFSEKGISGYKVSAKDRDAIQEIQHDAALGKFDILLVFMFDLIIILLSTLNDEPKGSNNYKIAKYMIENMRDLEEYSLTDLAQACYVSNSSISRFCRDIGLKDFNALKNQIAKFSVESARLKRKFDYEKYESSSMFQSYVKNVISNLNYFLENDIEKQINTLVQEISSYQKIAAFGYMQSESVACNLQFDLQTSGKLIFSCFNIKDQADYITDADENNLIIIFSESGTYFDRIFPRAKPFKSNKKKPKICMITSDQSIEYPFIDFYIRYNSKGGYASHPYPLQLISDLICIKYSETL